MQNQSHSTGRTNNEPSELIPRRSLQEEIASRLREEIVEGIWEPGARLHERVLCERYGVSRSPVREAFQIMLKEGLVELQANRGAIVTRPTLTDALENMEIVIALETLAIRLACEHASDEQLAHIRDLHQKMRDCSERNEILDYYELNNEVHQAIVIAGGNSALVSMHDHVDRHITRLQKLEGANHDNPKGSMDQHQTFIDALLRRNASAASAGLEAHLSSVTEVIKKRISESSE